MPVSDSRAWTRRDALVAAAAASVGLLVPRLQATTARNLLMTWGAGEEERAAGRGMQLAADEAARAASLVGAALAVDAHESAEAPRFGAGLCVAAVVRATVPRGAVVLDALGSLPVAWRVPTTVERRRACLDAALPKLPGGAAAWHASDAPPPIGDAADGVAWAAEWHADLKRAGAAQLNDRFRARFDAPMDARAWCGWAAGKIAAECLLRGGPPAASLERSAFDAHDGEPLRFTDRALRAPLHVVGRTPGTGRGPLTLLVADALA